MNAVYVVLHGVGSALWVGAAWAAVAALAVAHRVGAGDGLQGLVRGVQALTRQVLGPGMIATSAAGLLHPQADCGR